MKAWATYLIGIFLGIISALLFASNTYAVAIFYTLNELAINIGIMVLIPMIVLCLPSATASLMKDSLLKKVSLKNLKIMLIMGVLLPLLAFVAYYVYPIAFPVTSTSNTANVLEQFTLQSLLIGLDSFASNNPFSVIISASSFFIPIVLLAYIFGLALNPSSDVLRPAYVVFNSLSEVMHRAAKMFTLLSSVLIYATSSLFFSNMINEKTVFISPLFILGVLTFALFLYFAIIPLFFIILTKNKVNPYKYFSKIFPLAIASITTGNIAFTSAINMSLARHNLGVQKRISTFTTSWNLLFLKSGSAAIATYSVLALLDASGANVNLQLALLVALFCACASLISSMSLGLEVLFIMLICLKFIGVSLYGAEMAILGILPILNGLGILLDNQISIFSSLYCSYKTDTDIKISLEDSI